MKLECVQSYTENGCNFQTLKNENLLVIKYLEDVEKHPSYGEFGRSSIYYHVLDEVKKKAGEILAGKEYKFMLEIPDLVIRYKFPLDMPLFRTLSDLYGMSQESIVAEYARTYCPVRFDIPHAELVDIVIRWQEDNLVETLPAKTTEILKTSQP